MFLPTTPEEIKKLKWSRPDIILVSGDSYIDSPYIGIAVIGKVLMKAGFKVAIIAQPRMDSDADITRLGEPALFWGVSGGCVDSMVANYTATRKRRKKDDYTPGGENEKRPDRAVIAYANLIRRYFKQTAPIVLGGIEASLRRICHFDFWSGKIRRSILFDAKADYLVYGMGEKSIVELAHCLKEEKPADRVRGICYLSREKKEEFLQLPSFEEVKNDKHKFITMFDIFYRNNDPLTAKGLYQQHDARYLIHNPPSPCLTSEELDQIHDINYERELHPYYRKMGDVKALETIRFSIPTHRGCYGECNFCSIAIHQGRTVRWRSEDSILKEAEAITTHPDFKGVILDAGGPTANMYGFECAKKLKTGSCRDKRCLFPTVCPSLKADHGPQLRLLKKLRAVKGVKKVFAASGIRYDLVLSDKKKGLDYLTEITKHHVSGQLKIAPEHTENKVLTLMGKPENRSLEDFKGLFDRLSRKAGKKQFLTYYLIAAHPGCREKEMKELKEYTGKVLKTNPEQVQIFTPTPSTYSTLMYYTETDPFTGKSLFVEKDIKGKERQKNILVSKNRPLSRNRKNTASGGPAGGQTFKKFDK